MSSTVFVSEPKSPNINVGVPRDVALRLGQWCEDRGLIQRIVVGRVLTWFMGQPPVVQRMMMGNVDPGMEIAYAKALRDLADDIEAESGEDDVAPSAGLETLRQPPAATPPAKRPRATRG